MNIKKIIKTKLNNCIISTLLMVGITFFGIGGVKALPASIVLDNSSNSNYYCPFSSVVSAHCASYITFTPKTDTTGNHTYCLNRGNKMPTPLNGISKLTKGSRMTRSAGYSYILENGWANKAILGNNQKDNYVTQLAIWWYKDASQVSSTVKNSSSELVTAAKKLVVDAKNFQKKYDEFKDDSGTKPTVKVVVDSGFEIVGDYYVARFKVTGSASILTTYKMDVTAHSGFEYTVTDDSDKAVSSLSSLTLGNYYKVKVSTDSFKSDTVTSLSFKFNVSSSYTTYDAYQYNSNNGSYQDMILYEKGTDTVSATKTLSIYRKGVKFSKIDITDGDELAGAKMSVTAAEDIKDSAGTIKYKNGDVVESWTSSADAVHYIADMLPGKYMLNEIAAPAGYITAESVAFTVVDNNVVQKVVMKDQAKPCYVWIYKADASHYYIPVAGATLVIKDASGNQLYFVKNVQNHSYDYASSTTSGASNKIITDNTSWKLSGLPAGTYTLEETVAPTGYNINTEPRSFTIKNSGGNSCGTVNIADSKLPSKIKVAKVDPKGNYIAGAVLEIRETQTDKEEVVATITSTTEPIEIKDLPLGTYRLYETKAPDGYTISDIPVEFTVDADGGIEKVIKMANDLTPEVPNTLASISTILYIASGLAIVGGAYVIYKNKFSKKTKKVNK